MNKFRIISLLLIFITPNLVSCQNSSEQNSVTIEEKIGEMLMAGFKGYSVADTSHIIRDITNYHLGGVILFDYDVPTQTPQRNIESPIQVKNLIEQLQSLSDSPLFIAVDQEGGRVARLKTQRGFPPHQSAQYLGKIDNTDTTRAYAAQMSDLLSELGFNVNFAPVVDVNTNPENPVIGTLERSFSSDPLQVFKHSEIFVEEFQRNYILSVLKHFPGHGSAWNDSHIGMADVTDTWDNLELIPYREFANSDHIFAVMTAHVFNSEWDENDPATLSYYAQTELLRNDIGFDGVLFSDDMQMDAIRAFYGLETSILKAIEAGVDILIFANNSVYDSEIVPKAVRIIKNLIDQEKISEERIEESYQRITAAKDNLILN